MTLGDTRSTLCTKMKRDYRVVLEDCHPIPISGSGRSNTKLSNEGRLDGVRSNGEKIEYEKAQGLFK